METLTGRGLRSASGVTETLGELRGRLERLLGPDLLGMWLFGSHARGEAHEESDVDILVLIPEPSWEVRRRILDTAADLSVETGLLLSPTVMDRGTFDTHRSQERPLVTAVLREGRPL